MGTWRGSGVNFGESSRVNPGSVIERRSKKSQNTGVILS